MNELHGVFYRVENGNARLFDASGEVFGTGVDTVRTIWPVDSERSMAYGNSGGHVLTIADAEYLRIPRE